MNYNTKIKINDIFMERDSNIILDEYHVILYVSIYLFHNTALKETNMSLDMLYEMANISDKRTKQRVKQSLKDLSGWKYIFVDKANQVHNSTNIKVHINKTTTSTIELSTNSVLRIFQSEHQTCRKGNMLLVYILISRDNHVDIKTLSNILQVSTKTITSIVDELKDMYIIA